MRGHRRHWLWPNPLLEPYRRNSAYIRYRMSGVRFRNARSASCFPTNTVIEHRTELKALTQTMENHPLAPSFHDPQPDVWKKERWCLCATPGPPIHAPIHSHNTPWAVKTSHFFIFHCRKSGSRNTMVTSDFRPEVEIWPFRACAVKNMQYKPLLYNIGTVRSVVG